MLAANLVVPSELALICWSIAHGWCEVASECHLVSQANAGRFAQSVPGFASSVSSVLEALRVGRTAAGGRRDSSQGATTELRRTSSLRAAAW